MTFCPKCVSEKPINDHCHSCRKTRQQRTRTTEEFKARRRALRSQPHMKAKAAVYSLTYIQRNREHLLAHNRKWMREHPEYRKAHHTRRRVALLGANGSHTEAEWQLILKRHRNRCADCGLRFSDSVRATEDHVVPLTRGGTDFAFNLKPLCQPCNSRKNNRVGPGLQHSLFDRMDLAQ